jgi:hypothetical protein
LSFELIQAKLHRLVARPGWSWSSSVTRWPAAASRAATEAPRMPAPITTQRRDDMGAIVKRLAAVAAVAGRYGGRLEHAFGVG